MKGISLEQLDQCAPCTLTGDTEEDYEPLRTPPATPDETEPTIVFPHSFEVGSAELRESPGRAFEYLRCYGEGARERAAGDMC